VLTVKLICSVCTQFSKGRRKSKERRTERDDELRIVRVLRAIVRHCNEPTMRKAQTRVNLILELFYCPSHTRSKRVNNKKESGECEQRESRTSKERFPSSTRACFVTRLHEEIGDYTFRNVEGEDETRRQGE